MPTVSQSEGQVSTGTLGVYESSQYFHVLMYALQRVSDLTIHFYGQTNLYDLVRTPVP